MSVLHLVLNKVEILFIFFFLKKLLIQILKDFNFVIAAERYHTLPFLVWPQGDAVDT